VANYYEVMITVDELLKLARDCYAQANLTSNSLAKTHLVVMGDDYLKQAEGLQRDRSIVQAIFPMSGPRVGAAAGLHGGLLISGVYSGEGTP
jgi:ABC-type enterochelin transport system ATPase subunit